MIGAFFLILIISTALLFGNEFSIGFFIHPSLAREDHQAFLPAIQVFARLFGKIMPIWMSATLLLHLLLLLLTWRWPASHTVFLVSAVILWVIVIVFSVTGPVPINNRVKTWDINIWRLGISVFDHECPTAKPQSRTPNPSSLLSFWIPPASLHRMIVRSSIINSLNFFVN
jgi:hypothetical protein